MMERKEIEDYNAMMRAVNGEKRPRDMLKVKHASRSSNTLSLERMRNNEFWVFTMGRMNNTEAFLKHF